jgi:hypothetical protein
LYMPDVPALQETLGAHCSHCQYTRMSLLLNSAVRWDVLSCLESMVEDGQGLLLCRLSCGKCTQVYDSLGELPDTERSLTKLDHMHILTPFLFEACVHAHLYPCQSRRL